MAYIPYATVGDYEELIGTIPEGEENMIMAALRKASRHIDSLTYNRIVYRGFGNLTEFQQDIIIEVCCRLAAFELENDDMINTILSGYTINGVSVDIKAGMTVFSEYGVVMPKELYSTLIQTGLGCKLARR